VKRYLRTGEVGKLIGRDGRKVRRMCEHGRHFKHAFRDDGGQWFVPREDVETYLEFRRRNTDLARAIAKKRRAKADNSDNPAKNTT